MTEAAAPVETGQGAAAPAAAPTPIASSDAINVAPVAPTGSQSAAPAPNPIKWLEGADETTVGYVQNKGWSEPKQVLDGYRNLEKLLGADKANNAVIIPKEGADPKEWSALYDRIGRPTGPDGYKRIEGNSPELQNQMYGKFHELGLTKQQGESVAQWLHELGSTQRQQAQQAQQQRFQQDVEAIKQEWGLAYNQNLAAAQNAARGLGMDAETIDRISGVLGHAATMNFLQRIGAKMSEDTFVTGDKTENFSAALTPGQAKSQIQELMSDKDFTRKYLNGDAQAKAKMESLHKFAYPEG